MLEKKGIKKEIKGEKPEMKKEKERTEIMAQKENGKTNE